MRKVTGFVKQIFGKNTAIYTISLPKRSSAIIIIWKWHSLWSRLENDDFLPSSTIEFHCSFYSTAYNSDRKRAYDGLVSIINCNIRKSF